MYLDYTISKVMKLSTIKRWGIIDTSRNQSVAEHTYNVTMIALMIFNKLVDDTTGANIGGKVTEKDRATLLTWALVHDLPEILTGDLPTVIKADMREAIDKLENKHFPMTMAYERATKKVIIDIVKVADCMEAVRWASLYCVDVNKGNIISEMVNKVYSNIMSIEENHGVYLTEIVDSIWHY